MWYVSGNRDEDMFDNANVLKIERKNARNHISFVSASIVASACGLPNCSCVSPGKKSSSALTPSS